MAALAVAAAVAAAPRVRAQEAVPLTLAGALDRAGARHPRAALSALDSAAAAGRLAAARTLPDPTLVATVTRDLPRWHVEAEAPLDLPWIRSPRVEAARWALRAASATTASARAALAHDVTVAYEEAVAARETASVSSDAADEADRLLDVASRRNAAGDAAELDVLLARLEAARSRARADADASAARVAILALQGLLLLPVDAVVVDPVDPLTRPVAASLDDPAGVAPAADAPPFEVRAAEAEAAAARARLAGARAGRVPAPGLIVGVEGGGGGDGPGLLPLAGVSVTVPLFSRGRHDVAAARVEADAATLRVERATLGAAARRARATAEAASALARAADHERAVDDAERVVELTLVGYREGALPLVQLLEARRLALEARAGLVDALLAARVAEADLLLATTAGDVP